MGPKMAAVWKVFNFTKVFGLNRVRKTSTCKNEWLYSSLKYKPWHSQNISSTISCYRLYKSPAVIYNTSDLGVFSHENKQLTSQSLASLGWMTSAGTRSWWLYKVFSFFLCSEFWRNGSCIPCIQAVLFIVYHSIKVWAVETITFCYVPLLPDVTAYIYAYIIF